MLKFIVTVLTEHMLFRGQDRTGLDSKNKDLLKERGL